MNEQLKPGRPVIHISHRPARHLEVVRVGRKYGYANKPGGGPWNEVKFDLKTGREANGFGSVLTHEQLEEHQRKAARASRLRLAGVSISGGPLAQDETFLDAVDALVSEARERREASR